MCVVFFSAFVQNQFLCTSLQLTVPKQECYTMCDYSLEIFSGGGDCCHAPGSPPIFFSTPPTQCQGWATRRNNGPQSLLSMGANPLLCSHPLCNGLSDKLSVGTASWDSRWCRGQRAGLSDGLCFSICIPGSRGPAWRLRVRNLGYGSTRAWLHSVRLRMRASVSSSDCTVQ